MELEVNNYSFLKQVYANNYKKFIVNGYDDFSTEDLNHLNQNGYCILKNCLDTKLIESIKNKFQKNIDNLTNLNDPMDLRTINIGKQNVKVSRLKKHDLLKEEKHFRHNTYKISIKDPLRNVPEIITCALNKKILSLSMHYFKTLPYLTFCKLEKHYCNEMKDFDTQFFHFDDNAVNILKVFIYLQDINHISQGPFCYVKKSHQNIEKYWNEKVDLAVPGRAPRWDNNKIEQTFGKENIVPIFANKGDAIIANTVAFHKGIKPTIKDRSLMIINYNIHQDYVNNKPDTLPNIDNKEFEKLSKNEKRIFGILNKV